MARRDGSPKWGKVPEGSKSPYGPKPRFYDRGSEPNYSVAFKTIDYVRGDGYTHYREVDEHPDIERERRFYCWARDDMKDYGDRRYYPEGTRYDPRSKNAPRYEDLTRRSPMEHVDYGEIERRLMAQLAAEAVAKGMFSAAELEELLRGYSVPNTPKNYASDEEAEADAEDDA